MSLTRKVRGPASLFSVLLSLLLFSQAFAEKRLPVSEQIRLSIQGRDLLLSRDYVGAERFLSKLIQDWPGELLGSFGFMALSQVRNLDNFDFRFDPLYRQWEGRGRMLAQRIVDDENHLPWDLLVAGGTFGISGFYQAHNSKWFAALRDGYRAYRFLKRSYQDDPRLADALLGIGLYDYWRSYFTRKLRFLPFFPDRRNEGREELMQVAREGSFASVLAEIALAFVDFEDKKYQRVLGSTEGLLKRYPKNTIFRMLQGQALLALKRYAEAEKVFQEILSIDPTVTKSYLFLGISYAREGREITKARENLIKFLQSEPGASTLWRKPALEWLKRHPVGF